MKNVKPCPFCGGTADLLQNPFYSKRERCYQWFVLVKCEICGAAGRAFVADLDDEPEKHNWDTKECELAVEAWNRRVNEGAQK